MTKEATDLWGHARRVGISPKFTREGEARKVRCMRGIKNGGQGRRTLVRAAALVTLAQSRRSLRLQRF